MSDGTYKKRYGLLLNVDSKLPRFYNPSFPYYFLAKYSKLNTSVIIEFLTNIYFCILSLSFTELDLFVLFVVLYILKFGENNTLSCQIIATFTFSRSATFSTKFFSLVFNMWASQYCNMYSYDTYKKMIHLKKIYIGKQI